MKKLMLYTLALLLGLSMQSCLHDNNEVFDEPAAQRIDKSIESSRQLLESAPNGWMLHYYIGSGYTLGGYTYFLKFKDGKASVSSEIADADMVTTSSYNITRDQGPVLTFDTYNPIMHALAEATQQNVEGVQGDYEFVIMRATQDSIYLKGKKWGNTMVMTRVADGFDEAAYIQGIQTIRDSLMTSYVIRDGADSIGLATVSTNDRQFSYKTNDSESLTTDAFYFNPDGISVRQAVTLNGKTVRNFRYNIDEMKFYCTDKGSESINLTFNRPTGYTKYAQLAGNYTLQFTDGDSDDIIEMPIVIKANGDNKTYSVTGIIPNHALTFLYNRSNGGLEWRPQLVQSYSDGNMWIIVMDNVQGFIYFDTTAGLMFVGDDKGNYNAKSNGLTSINVTGMYLAGFKGEMSTTTFDRSLRAKHKDIYFFGSLPYIGVVKRLVKTN